ncbi:tetratricopeptide repeat protein [Aequorivita sp. H23M31]|uniref:Tetratricopeptide repeat protein n=1 Tax=Aequorivita ciconiae TaxID=2494375 RepID=A0A410G596_9FLAO|nr:tetratricopeptide repeat protein [Aequorivita sp. H23M31]QAA82433.1 tetratricopeptide repeat protein [Aequorivita sp. H23M31]
MITKKILFSIFIFGVFLLPKALIAQEKPTDSIQNPMDQLGIQEDKFQENFFEALKQKAIENHELALAALNKAKDVAKTPEENAVVFFEMGKNYAALKVYDEAEVDYKKVLDILGDRLDVLQHLYDLYYQEKDYEKALPLVRRLIPYDEDYKEDLANLLTLTKNYDEAIAQLDELDNIWGESDIRNALRAQIYRATGNTAGAIENLEQKIDSNPKNEKEYLSLIFLYSEQDNKEKAFETAKNLLKSNPKSQLVHLALYKFYLDEGNTTEALKSMKIVFSSNQIDEESKYRVLGDFIQFVNKNPEYEQDLEAMATLFSEENGGKVYEKLGDYFSSKSQKEQALHFYEKGIAHSLDNYNLLKNTLLLQLDVKKYNEAAALSEKGLEIFPAQALLYLLNGVANNGLEKFSDAIESLETGLDFLLDDPQMEFDFYNQLQVAYTAKNDLKKAKFYSEKASQIQSSN